jgi:hypothetical protein
VISTPRTSNCGARNGEYEYERDTDTQLGVFCAVLAALAVGGCFVLGQVISNFAALVKRIEGSLDSVEEKIGLADPHDTLDSIETLLECRFDMSAKEARELNIERVHENKKEPGS